MNSILRASALVSCALLAFGCGLRDKDIDAESAGQIVSEVVTASNSAWDNIQPELNKTDGTWLTWDGDSFTVSGSLTNARGGSLTVTGSGQRETSGGYTLSLTYAFEAWQGEAYDVELSGSLTLSITVDSLAPLRFTIGYTGNLSVTGEVKGTASFDVELSRDGPLSWSYCGEVSGFAVTYGAGCDG